MQLKLLLALGADLPGLRVPPVRSGTVVDAEAVREREVSSPGRRLGRSTAAAALPSGPRAHALRDRGPARRGRVALPAPPMPAAVAPAAGGRPAAIPAFDAGTAVGLPSLLDVTV